MKVDLAYAERQLRHWTKKVEELRLTSNASNAKEDEKGKEGKSPRTPLKEVKGKDEEKKNKNARARARFVPPTPEEVTAYCRERKNSVDPVLWWNYYAAKGWMIGKSKMVDWKRAVITWERNRTGDCGRDPSRGRQPDTAEGRARPFLDPRTAAFERQRAEAEERRRRAAEIATRLLTECGALPKGGAR